jgi:hypothetical protein
LVPRQGTLLCPGARAAGGLPYLQRVVALRDTTWAAELLGKAGEKVEIYLSDEPVDPENSLPVGYREGLEHSDQQCIRSTKLLPTRSRPHMAQSGHWETRPARDELDLGTALGNPADTIRVQSRQFGCSRTVPLLHRHCWRV